MHTSGAGGTHRFFLEPPDGRSLAALRAWIRAIFPDLNRDTLIDVELVSTELATNAIEHAAGPRSVGLSYHPDTATVRVEVQDSSPDLPPNLGRSRHGRNRGRGLAMVARMARWGIRSNGKGKVIWAEIPAPP